MCSAEYIKFKNPYAISWCCLLNEKRTSLKDFAHHSIQRRTVYDNMPQWTVSLDEISHTFTMTQTSVHLQTWRRDRHQ